MKLFKRDQHYEITILMKEYLLNSVRHDSIYQSLKMRKVKIFLRGICMNFFILKLANNYYRYIRLLGLILTVSIIGSSSATSIPALDLKSTENFVILAGSTVTGIPPVSIVGNVGLSPAAGSFVIGFDGSNVDGILYVVDATGPAGSVENATLLQTAKSDLTTAYNDAAGRTPVPTGPYLNPGSGNIGGLNLVPGLYKFTSGALITGSDVTLTGNSTDVWIFQIASSLGVGSGIKVILAGGAQAANIFWQVGTSATLGTYSTFKGTILADQSISMGTGSSFDGRALAFTGAVTFESGIDFQRSDLKFPEFSSDKDTLNFGTVANGSSKTDSITVTNTGDADLVIDSVRSPNAVFTVSPGNATIAMGMTKKYYVTYSPVNGSVNNGYVYFYHNDPDKKDSIYVTGSNAAPEFSANKDTINFGNVTTGTMKQDSITVTNTGNANLVINTITFSNNSYTIDPSNGTIAGGASKKFYVEFAPLTDGAKNGNIIFNHNASIPRDTIIVTGTGVSGKFVVIPTNLNFGNVENGTSKNDSVTVSNEGTTNIIVSSITASNGLFTTNANNFTLAPNESRVVIITFAPLVDGNQNGNIIFHHNAPNLRDTVTVSGTGVSAKLTVNPSSLNFGDVVVGTSKKDSITVTNTGASDAVITSITSSNALFSSSASAFTLAPNQSKIVYITFSPLVDGNQNGNISINHTGTNSPEIVPVSGRGVSAKFSVNPNNLNFGDVVNGTSKSDSVTVTNIGTSNLIISSISSTNSVFTTNMALVTLAPNESKVIKVTFSPVVDGNQSGNIVFNHNGQSSPDMVNVSGRGVSPKFTVNPSNVNFGDVRNGTSKLDSVIVTNTGTSDLHISGVISSNSRFTTNNEVATIAPNASKVFYITFSPLVDGNQNGNVYFTHDALTTPNAVAVSGRGVSPKFTLNKANINFGQVRNGTNKTDSVIVTNTGTYELTISSVTRSNTLFVTSPSSGVIAPGASKTFYITFSPLVDGFTSGFTFFNHDAINSRDSVTVSGTGVSPQFSANPTNINFGDVRNGTSKTSSVIISNPGTYPLTISSITSSNSVFTVNSGAQVIAPGSSAVVEVTFAPLVDGNQNGNITFNHDALTNPDVVTVSGRGVSPQFSANPTNIDFGDVRNGTTKMESITVSNPGTYNLTISSIISSNGLFTVNSGAQVIAPGSSAVVEVTFAPLVDGNQNGSIKFNHDALTSPNFVTVSGRGVSPKFAVTPNNINFGDVRNGTTKMESVTVSNPGTFNLTISSITSSNGLFTISSGAQVIAPGSSAVINITFAPLVDGNQSGNITFNHDAVNSPGIVTVSGRGVSPKFAVTPTHIDFGDVRNGTTKMETVTVSNPGTYPLTISSITSSNGVYSVSPGTQVIAAGSSAVINITFAPLVDGIQNGDITFNHDALTTPDVVTVTGRGVSPKFAVTPKDIDFGDVRNGTMKTVPVLVSNPGTYPLTISSIISSNNLFTVNSNSEVILPGESVVLNITFAPIVDGVQTGNIVFNNDALSSPDVVTVRGNGVSSKFEINMVHLDFGDVRTGTTKTMSVTISNPGTASLNIGSILSTNEYYTASSETVVILPGGSAVIDITFAPLIDGIQNGEIVFNHDALIKQNIITVTGNGVSPHLSVDRGYLDFGDVRVGTSKLDSVVVTNTGEYELVIFSVTSTYKLFSVSPTTGTLAPGASRTYYITFTPIEDGPRHGYVYFNSTSSDQNFPVSVKGNGVAPRFTILPPSLNFGMVKLESNKTETVIVTNTGNMALDLSALSLNTAVFNISPSSAIIEAGDSKEFFITFTPQVEGLVFDFINFIHNDPGGNDWYSVSGIGGDDGQYPVFHVDNAFIDFGTLIIGDSKQKVARITNNGLIDLNITQITSSDVHFNILQNSAVIAPGAFQDFVITFAPTVVGQVNGQIEFTHNAGRDIVNVTGKGIEIISISDARRLPLGTEFAIEGIVTRTLGSYTRIQDQTAALTIVQHSGDFYEDIVEAEIRMSDKLRVHGIMSEIDHLKVINGANLIGFERISRSNTMPSPVKVTLLEISNNGEQYESQLITLVELRLKLVGNTEFLESTSYLVSDPSDMNNSVDIRIGADANTYMNGMPFFETGSFVGVLGQSSQSSATSGYQLTPVLPTDLFYVVSGVEDNENASVFTLAENYPNPFSKSSTIGFDLVKSDFVTLRIIDVLGNVVKTLIDNNYMNEGNHSVTFTIDDNSQVQNSGVYFYRLDVGKYSSTKQMMFVK